MDRRSFVTSLTVAAATAALPSDANAAVAAAPAESSRGPTVPRTNIAIKTRYTPLPPLDGGVFERRLERARQLTRDAGGDALIATSGATNFAYLVGADYGRSERLIALVLPVEGPPTLIAPAFEVERVRRGSRIGAPVRGWEEQEDPFALVRAVVRGSGAAGRRDTVSGTGTPAGNAGGAIVVEPKTDYWAAIALAKALPEIRLIDGSTVFEQLRLVKSPEEITRMRRAIEITEDAIAATFDALKPGMRDVDVAKRVADEHARRGVTGGGLVQFSEQSALPHGVTSGANLAPAMVSCFDACR